MRVIAAFVAAALAVALVLPAAAKDNGKKNQGFVTPNFAAYGVTRIALGGVVSVDRDATHEKVFRDHLENAFAATHYRFQSLATFTDAARHGGVQAQVALLQKSAFGGAPVDSATLAALRAKLAIDAVLFVNLTRMEKNRIDADTRGQSSTDVGAEFVLLSLKDGAWLWRGNFADRGLGPYNDPNVADVGQRDPTGNAQSRPSALDPPDFPDVLPKFLATVTASLPPPPAPPAQATAAPAPAPATPGH